MRDNFEIIRNIINFDKIEHTFFHVQLIARCKDISDSPSKSKSRLIKNYFIKSMEHYDHVKEEIIAICESCKARAYINTTPKDMVMLNKMLLAELANNNIYGTIQDPEKVIVSVASKLKSKGLTRWIIDVDDVSQKDDIIKWLENWNKNQKGRKEKELWYEIVPTKSNIHLIVEPFNVKEFSKEFPDVDVHKNSAGTILYSPKSID